VSRVAWGLTLAACALGVTTRRIVAQEVTTAPLTRGTLSFDAKASLGAFTGTTTTMTGEMHGAASLAGVRGWVEAPSKSLSTSNGHRDRDMASSLEIDKFPVIHFDLDSASAGQQHGDSAAVTLHGRFTIHGQTHSVSIAGWTWVAATGARFRGVTPIDVKDYGVGGLSKMLGVLKMNQMITVRIDVVFGHLPT
jgi:polyisoprenoid-binding protein YceI